MPISVGTRIPDVMTFLNFCVVVNCLPTAEGMRRAAISRGREWPADGDQTQPWGALQLMPLPNTSGKTVTDFNLPVLQVYWFPAKCNVTLYKSTVSGSLNQERKNAISVFRWEGEKITDLHDIFN